MGKQQFHGCNYTISAIQRAFDRATNATGGRMPCYDERANSQFLGCGFEPSVRTAESIRVSLGDQSKVGTGRLYHGGGDMDRVACILPVLHQEDGDPKLSCLQDKIAHALNALRETPVQRLQASFRLQGHVHNNNTKRTGRQAFRFPPYAKITVYLHHNMSTQCLFLNVVFYKKLRTYYELGLFSLWLNLIFSE